MLKIMAPLFVRTSRRLAVLPSLRFLPSSQIRPSILALSSRAFATSIYSQQQAMHQKAVKDTANHLTPQTPQKNAWAAPGPAAFDFRSDVVTTPTTAMLNAIVSTTLLDDVFLEDPTTINLESFVAELAGKEAGLLVLSGTMGNQVSLRTHIAGPPTGILCDRRSHIVQYEAGGASSLSGAMLQALIPKNGRYLTYEEIVEEAVISDDVHACPTKIISLENTLNGMVLPLEEVKKIHAFAKEHRIILHLDGARLWEAAASGAGSLKEYCLYFDTISLCFSKGLGAPIGSIIVGKKDFIKRARWIRKMLGGGLRQAGLVSSAARIAVEDTYLGGKLKKTHENALIVKDLWEKLGGKLVHPVETNMVWLDIAAAGIDVETFVEAAKRHGVRAGGGRLVIHYQVGQEGIERLQTLFEDVLGSKAKL
jgi:threonine aldolase